MSLQSLTAKPQYDEKNFSSAAQSKEQIHGNIPYGYFTNLKWMENNVANTGEINGSIFFYFDVKTKTSSEDTYQGRIIRA